MATFILVLSAIQVIVVMFGLYQGVISLFGIFLSKKPNLAAPSKKIAVVVAAHNEESVVAGVVKSILRQEYPRELFDVMVICDNCTDGTAEIVRENGGQAFERFDKYQKGKGYALEWMFEQIYKMDKNYEAIVVLDADNLISSNFLLTMNNMLCKGHKVIQGYLDSKNPDDSWVTLSYAIAYWYMGRMWQLARYRLGLPNALGGTGMCFEINTLQKLGWDTTSLTEDLEFTMKAVLNGIRPVWAHHVKVYDEKPIDFKASWNQRLRWMRGHWDVAFKYIPPLFKRLVNTGDICALDSILYLLQPSRILLSYFTLIITIILALTPYVYSLRWLNAGIVLPKYVWFSLFLMQWIIPPSVAIIMILERLKPSRAIALIWYQFFGVSWFPLTLIGLFTRKNKVWSHTMHTRKVDIESLEGTIEPVQQPILQKVNQKSA